MIELLIVVAVVGILAAIALPSYFAYVVRANRADARAVLMRDAQFLERNYTVANRYDQDSAGNATVLPFLQSPETGAAKYNIAIAYEGGAASKQTFTLSATPTGSMTGDACGILTLAQTGARGSGGDVDTCWNK